MYEWNYFYGAIMLDMDYAKNPTRNYDDALNFIGVELPKKNYYYFHSNIFSTAVKEYPFYYDNILISFGRTGKYLFYNAKELIEFIKEFEDILENLDFENAQVKLTSPLGSYSFFWRNKRKFQKPDLSSYFDENKIRYYENSVFYFGFGEINLHTGSCEKKYDDEELKSFDIEFPDFKYD
jgi:hypothetical protein